MRRLHEHDELRAFLSVVTPATLPPEQIDRVLRHADECPACGAELRDFAALAILAQTPALSLEPPSAQRLRGRILAHIAPERAPARDRAPRPAPRPRPRPRRTGGVGWMAAAALAVALLTHHGFHQPLSSGWLAAAGFALVALGLGVYASVQRRRLVDLRDQLSSAEPAQSRHGESAQRS